MSHACERFSTADDGKKGMGSGCSVFLRNAVSDSSGAGAEAEGVTELIITDENSHLILNV